MKKRRELDALVNGKLGKSKSRKTSKKGSGHELLHNESDSSDVEEFSLAAQKTIIRHGPSRICATCIPLCGFFLLVACMVAVGGLVWVHIKLRNDLDHLRMQLRAVESGNKNTPDAFQQIHSQLKAVEDNVKTLKTDTGKHETRLDAIDKGLGNLRENTDNLQNRLKDSPALANLPKSVDDLSKNVAAFGSDMKSLQTNVNSLLKFKTQEESSVTALQKRVNVLESSKYVSSTVAPSVSTPAPAMNQYVQERLEVLSHDLSLVNASVAAHLTLVSSQIQQQQVRLEGLQNKTEQLQARLGLLELSLPSSNKLNMSDINSVITDAVGHMAAQLQNASNSHEVAGQDTLTGLANQIQNITDMVTEYRQQFDKFKSAWETGKLDHINLNMTEGYKDILQNALKSYTARTQGRIEVLDGTVTQLNITVQDLQQTVHQQAVTLASLSTAASVQHNQTTGLHEQRISQSTPDSTPPLKHHPTVSTVVVTTSPITTTTVPYTTTVSEEDAVDDGGEHNAGQGGKNVGDEEENSDGGEDVNNADTENTDTSQDKQTKEKTDQNSVAEDTGEKSKPGKHDGSSVADGAVKRAMPQENVGIRKKSVSDRDGQGEINDILGVLDKAP